MSIIHDIFFNWWALERTAPYIQVVSLKKESFLPVFQSGIGKVISVKKMEKYYLKKKNLLTENNQNAIKY